MSANGIEQAGLRPARMMVTGPAAWARLWRLHFVPLSLSAGLVGMTAPRAGATWVSMTMGLLVCVFGYGIGVVINDWFDRKADAVNAPDRPFVAGLINPNVALGLTFLLSGALLVLAYLAAPPLAIWSAIAVGGHFVYTWTKGIPMVGNIVNGVDMSLFILLGAAAVRPEAGWLDIPKATLVQTALVAVVLSGFCLVGYFKDISGDAIAGYRTLPVVWSARSASRIAILFPAAALAAAAFVATAHPAYLGEANAAFWVLLVASATVFMMSLTTLVRAPEENAYEALLWFTRATTLFTLSLGAANRALPFLLGTVPMMIYLEFALRDTRPSRQA